MHKVSTYEPCNRTAVVCTLALVQVKTARYTASSIVAPMQVKPCPRIKTVGCGGTSGTCVVCGDTMLRSRFVLLLIIVEGLNAAARPPPRCSLVTSIEWRLSELL